MGKNAVINTEFRIPIWSEKKVREYLRTMIDIATTYKGITEIDFTESNYMIFVVFNVVLKGRRKYIRITERLIEKKITEITDG